MSGAYGWLTAEARGDPADRHVLACVLALALGEARPPTVALGLTRAQLTALLARYFPQAIGLAGAQPDGDAPLAPEELDLRALLRENATGGGAAEAWLAAIIARRALGPNHLWQDLGLTCRAELGGLMRRHFAPLAARNIGDMKWKKFFYRQLCGLEDIALCKAPNCAVCCDFAHCFGDEPGEPLARLAMSQMRQATARI